MKHFDYKLIFGLLAVIAIVLSVTVCDGDGGDAGSLTLGITDAPVDEADKIVVEFTGIELEKA